jgi:hypothetical protein
MSSSGPKKKLRLVVRGLPFAFSASLMEDVFELPSGFPSSSFLLVPRPNIHNTSLAFVSFRSEGELKRFHEKYHGHRVVDEKGNEHQISIEYSVSQLTPGDYTRIPRRVRESAGKLEKQNEYKKFLISLNEPVEFLPPADVQWDQMKEKKEGSGGEKSGAGKETALLQSIRERNEVSGKFKQMKTLRKGVKAIKKKEKRERREKKEKERAEKNKSRTQRRSEMKRVSERDKKNKKSKRGKRKETPSKDTREKEEEVVDVRKKPGKWVMKKKEESEPLQPAYSPAPPKESIAVVVEHEHVAEKTVHPVSRGRGGGGGRARGGRGGRGGRGTAGRGRGRGSSKPVWVQKAKQ